MSPFGNLLVNLLIFVIYVLLGEKSLFVIGFIVLIILVLTICNYSERIKLRFFDLDKYKRAEVNSETASFLITIVNEIAKLKNTYPPKIYIDTFANNVLSLFTIGRSRKMKNNISKFSYTGILIVPAKTLELLNNRELSFIVAHEMTHLIRSDSIKFSTASMIATLIPAFSIFILAIFQNSSPSIPGGLIVLTSIAIVFFFQRKVFFKLEFDADKNAVTLALEASKKLGEEVNFSDITEAGIQAFTKYG